MAIDRRYIEGPSLQSYFVDKDTGLPLANGRIDFYQDDNRTIRKNVYTITGNPPDYTYTPLDNPVTLSAVGTPVDGDGNDVLLLYFPYDADGNIQNYYIEVYDDNGVLQFTREGYPFVDTSEASAEAYLKNFVPNPQFILHNDHETTLLNDQGVTEIAPGGWTIEHTYPSTASLISSFERIGSVTSVPTGNPRYKLRFGVTSAGADEFKDLRLTFRNVNKFDSNTLEYNLYFEANSVGGSLTGIQVLVLKHFGVGGSDDQEIEIGTLDLTTSSQKFNYLVQIPLDTSKVIGSGDDDTVSFVLRFPSAQVGTYEVTNFCFSISDEILSEFPESTDEEQMSVSLPGGITPSYDGSKLYLPIINTPSGFSFDDSVIGNVEAQSRDSNDYTNGRVFADGRTLKYSDYSSEGIPFSRLADKYWDDTNKYFIYGSGRDFISAYILDNGKLLISTNKEGSVTQTDQPGSLFTFLYPAEGNDYEKITGVYDRGSGVFVVSMHGIKLGFVNQPTASGTSPFLGEEVADSSNMRTFSKLEILSLPSAGQYFQFGNTTTSYYGWFTVDGAGSDPAPGGTGIRINIESTYSVRDLATVIAATINGSQLTTVDMPAASSITGGDYFRVYVNNSSGFTQVFVWYEKDNVGIDPTLSGEASCKVKILSSDNSESVTSKTLEAINKLYYGLPDYRGMFLRGIDNGTDYKIDPTTIERIGTPRLSPYYGDSIGTYQFDAMQNHKHGARTFGNNNDSGNGFIETQGSSAQTDTIDVVVDENGQAESRPINRYVKYMIRY